MAIISDFQDDETPRQMQQAAARSHEALVAALEQSGDAAMFLQAAINIAHKRSDFFRDPSAVSKVTEMASAARAQVEDEERRAKRKAQEAERKAREAERASKAAAAPAPTPTPAPASAEKAESSEEKKDKMEVDKQETNVRREYSCSSPFEIDFADAL